MSAFEQALAAQVAADREGARVPPVATVRRRATRRRQRRAAAGSVLVVALLGSVAATVPPSAPPSTGGELATPVAPDEVELARGVGRAGPWRVVARVREACVVLVDGSGEGGACGIVSLQESPLLAVDGGQTLVAGVVPAGADLVEVFVPGDDRPVGTRLTAQGERRWFVGDVPVGSAVSRIRAVRLDGSEVEVADRELPPPPAAVDPATPPPPALVAPAPRRLEAQDDFGLVEAVRRDSDVLTLTIARVQLREDADGSERVTQDEGPLTTYPLAEDAVVWVGPLLGDGDELERLPLPEWVRRVETDRGRSVLHHVDVRDGVVVGLEERVRS